MPLLNSLDIKTGIHIYAVQLARFTDQKKKVAKTANG